MRNSIIMVFAAILCQVIFTSQVPAASVLTPEELNNLKAETKHAQGPARFRVFALKNITADQGKQFLADANFLNVTQLNDANTLVVSDDPEKLIKAAALINLVDSKDKYEIKSIMPEDEVTKLPKNDFIASEITKGGTKISIGTFFSLPGGSGYKAILDIYEGNLVAVAPASVMDKLVDTVQKHITGQAVPETNTPNTTQQPDVNMSEPNAQFNELLGSIDKAQKEISKATTVLAESNKAKKSEPNQSKSISMGHKGEPNLAESQKKEVNEDEPSRSYEPLVIPNANETIELALPEKLQMVPFLDLVGKYLNLNYVYDEKKVPLGTMEINLKVQGKIKVGELYPLMESVLRFEGLAMTRKGNLITITNIADAMDIDPKLIEQEGGTIHAGDVVIARVFQLSYVDNASAKSLLEQMKLGVVTDVSPGTIIVTGYAYRMARVEQILDVVDKPGRPKQFKFRQLKYTMAKTLAPKIKGLVEQLGDITISLAKSEATPATPQSARRAPIRPTPPGQPQPTTPSTSEAAKSTLYLDADERTNRILMIGRDEELTVVNDLIDSLDVAQQDLRSLRMYEIQHVGADEVKKKLEELGIIGASKETQTPGRITSRQAPGQQPGQQPMPTPTQASANAEGEMPTEEMQVVVVESTNSLLVNGSPEQHALISTIISYVDSESIQQSIPYVVYPLQNQPPEHVAAVLDKLIQEVVRDEKGKVEKVVKKTEDNITIVPDPNTFSLIVYATKKNQDWIASLIKTLDRRRPQVLIDVTLVEIDRTDNFDLDLQLAGKLPNMIPGTNMTFLPALLGGRGDTNGFPKGTQKEFFVSGGTGQAFYSDKHIQSLITAMETKNYGRILAKPKILVNDGQKGIIKTTDTTNVSITGNTVVGAGSASSGVVQTSTTFQAYNAGITLEIQPNIGEGDLLLLIVKLDRTDFGQKSIGPGGSEGPPDTLSSTVDTIVTVPNNKTIILGGLLKLNQGKGGSKVPILGDIPLVGGLFRSTTNSVNDSKLYVFVKANILRPEATMAGLPELENISETSRSALEKNEAEFQKYQDWPGIKPQPVDPVRVLEAE